MFGLLRYGLHAFTIRNPFSPVRRKHGPRWIIHTIPPKGQNNLEFNQLLRPYTKGQFNLELAR